jgi:hypothetical protein
MRVLGCFLWRRCPLLIQQWLLLVLVQGLLRPQLRQQLLLLPLLVPPAVQAAAAAAGDAIHQVMTAVLLPGGGLKRAGL